MSILGRALLIPTLQDGIVYLLRAIFNTAPNTTSPIGEYPTGYIKAVDSNGIASITASGLLLDGTPALNDRLVGADAAGDPLLFTRKTGRAFILRLSDTTNTFNTRMGWVSSAGSQAITGIRFTSFADIISAGTVLGSLPRFGLAEFAFIMRASGIYIVDIANNDLLWVIDDGTGDLYAQFITATNTVDMTISEMAVRDLGEPWASDTIVEVDETTPATGYTATISTDVWVRVNVTTSATLATDLSIRLRKNDTSFIDIALLSADPDKFLRLREVVSGSPTTRITGSTLSASTTYEIILIISGTDARMFLDGALQGTYSSLLFDGQTGFEISNPSNEHTLDLIEIYPKNVSID